MKKYIHTILCVALLVMFLSCDRVSEEIEGLEKTEINVAGLFALSGPAQVIGIPSLRVSEYLIEEFNKNSPEYVIKLRIADTQSNPAQARQALERLIRTHGVVAVIGPTTTGACMACLPAIEAAQIPMIACVGASIAVEPVEERYWVFKSPQKSSTAIEKIFEYLQKEGKTNIVMLYSDDMFGQEGLEEVNALHGQYNINVLDRFAFDQRGMEFKVFLRRAVSSDADAVLVWTIGPAGPIITRNYRELELEPLLVQCHGQPTPDFLEIAGRFAEGTVMPATRVMVLEDLDDDDPVKDIIQDFIHVYENVQNLGPVGTHSSYAWDATNLMLNAIEKAGDNPAAIRDAIENTRDFPGVSGTYNMSPEDHCGLDTDSLVMTIVEDNTFRLLEY